MMLSLFIASGAASSSLKITIGCQSLLTIVTMSIDNADKEANNTG